MRLSHLCAPFVALVALVLAGCSGAPRPLLSFQIPSPRPPTYLRYHVRSPSGEMTREIAIYPGGFAERRQVGDRQYVIGLSGNEAWMQIGSNPPVEIDGALAAEERRDAALFGLGFLDPEPGGVTELESCHHGVCTFVHVPKDGRALWIDVPRGTWRPASLAWIANETAVEACVDLVWSDDGDRAVLLSATCRAIVHKVGRETTTWTLDRSEVDTEAADWARVAREDVVPLRPLSEVASFSVEDPSSRVYAPVSAGLAAAPMKLVVDTGSPRTILSRAALGSPGIVRSLEPPIHFRPPYLPEATYDAAIIDRLFIGDVELHGVHVLVDREGGAFSGDEQGLLGMDVLSAFVLDIDGPRSTMRLWPRGAFAPDESFVDLPFYGASRQSVIVAGEVDRIGEVSVIVDTGAPVNLIVGGPAMHSAHPHHRADDVSLSETSGASDYGTEIDRFRLGPFSFPKMPVYGHDRRPDLPFLDDDGALVGLGVLRHLRLVIDSHDAVVHVAPGPSYVVLNRFGLEIDNRNGAPTVARIVGHDRSWRWPLREGDVVRVVNRHRVSSRDEALDALARAEGQVVVTVERQGNRVVALLEEP